MPASIADRLKDTVLFEGYTPAEIVALTDALPHRMSTFERGTPVAVEGARCGHIGLILRGSVEIQKVMASGRAQTLDRLEPGQVFGEALVFSRRRRYPATITATADTIIMFIPAGEIIRLCRREERFLENFLGLLSGKILMLNRRLQDLSHGSIRQKLAARILDLSRDGTSREVRLGVSRRALAEELGVSRPSLSRELGRMRADGLITFSGDTITILDPDALEDVLFG